MQVKKVVIILNRIVIGGQATDTIPLAFYLKEEFDIQIFCGQKENDDRDMYEVLPELLRFLQPFFPKNLF